jgi:hypothetical protein
MTPKQNYINMKKTLIVTPKKKPVLRVTPRKEFKGNPNYKNLV